MRKKHLHIESDSRLLAEIRRKVTPAIRPDAPPIRRALILKLLFYTALSSVLYAALYLPFGQGFFMASYVLLGISLILFALNFAHDFSHNTVFKNKQWNSIGFVGIFTLVGAHAEAWRDRHIHAHHFAPNVQAYDPDLQLTNIIRVSPDMEHKWYHRFQHLYAPIAYAIYSLFWIFIKDFVLLYETISQQQASAGYLLTFFLQKALYLLYILIGPLLFAPQSTGIVITGFLLMHLIQSVFLLFTFFMTHHVEGTAYPDTDNKGVIQTSWLMNQVRSSNDMHPFSPLANFIFGGFNNHIAHHLFPHIHHIHYPKMNRVLYQVLSEHGVIPNHTTYVGGCISHLKLLKKMGSL